MADTTLAERLRQQGLPPSAIYVALRRAGWSRDEAFAAAKAAVPTKEADHG